MMILALTVAAYLVGSIPTSYLLARTVRGIDLRDWGSGNLGATNLYRATGLPLASASVLVDVGKGFVPAWWFPRVDGTVAPELALAYGLAAMLGHIYSVWMGFRGGKGVATGGGVYLALAPVAVALAAILWVSLVLTKRIVSIGSLVATTALPVLIWLTRGVVDYVFWSTLPVVAFVWWTHRENIGRLLAGEELPARQGVGAPGGGTAGTPGTTPEGRAGGDVKPGGRSR